MKIYTINLLFYEKLKNAPLASIQCWGKYILEIVKDIDCPKLSTLDDNSITIKMKQVN